MRKSLNWSAVSQWQRLMGEWEALSAEYDSVRDRSREPGLREDQRKELEATAERTLVRLRELKVSIDELISKGTAERETSGDQLTVATIEIGRNTDETDEDSPAPRRGIPSVK